MPLPAASLRRLGIFAALGAGALLLGLVHVAAEGSADPAATAADSADLAPLTVPVVQPAVPAPPRPTAHRASRAAPAPARPAAPPWRKPATTKTGIPRTVDKAYRHAARMFKHYDPACRLDAALLEAIGKVESDHAYNGYVDRKGEALLPIIGPALDGRPGLALIHASPLGKQLHGDPVYEHAVGPMQFLPETYREWATAGHRGKKTSDPENVFDAAATAARYLCGSGGDLSDPKARHAAVLRYNKSEDYAGTVEAWFQAYAGGAAVLPDSHDAVAAKRYATADNPPAKATHPGSATPATPGRRTAPGAPPAPAPQAAGTPVLPPGAPGRGTAPPGNAPDAGTAAPERPGAPKAPPTVGDEIGRLAGTHAPPGAPTEPLPRRK